jgi:hypothetical protein
VTARQRRCDHPADIKVTNRSRANSHVVHSIPRDTMWRKEPPQDIYYLIGRQPGWVEKVLISTLNHACTRIDGMPIKALRIQVGDIISVIAGCGCLVPLNQKQKQTRMTYFSSAARFFDVLVWRLPVQRLSRSADISSLHILCCPNLVKST